MTPRGEAAQPPPSSMVGGTGSTQALPLQILLATQSAVVAQVSLQRPELSQRNGAHSTVVPATRGMVLPTHLSPAVQAPVALLHTKPDLQSASVAHVVLHEVAPHAKG